MYAEAPLDQAQLLRWRAVIENRSSPATLFLWTKLAQKAELSSEAVVPLADVLSLVEHVVLHVWACHDGVQEILCQHLFRMTKGNQRLGAVVLSDTFSGGLCCFVAQVVEDLLSERLLELVPGGRRVAHAFEHVCTRYNQRCSMHAPPAAGKWNG